MAEPQAADPAAHLDTHKQAVLSILSHALPPMASDAQPYMGQECIGLGDAWRALYGLVRSSVYEHEGNSCLVAGESGCGKSVLVESVLRYVQHECMMERVLAPWTVRLSALVHPTDRLCLSAMARQLMDQDALSQNNQVDDMLGPEQEEEEDDEDRPLIEWAHASASEDEDDAPMEEVTPAPTTTDANAILSTLAAALSHILSLLSTHTLGKRPLVLILDQFDQFAQRPRQALLYCLLDAVQSGSYAPGLVVIGTSTRVDATDFLEKRVKSRFSHRIVHVHPPSFDQYVILARTALLGGMSNTLPPDAGWEKQVDALLQDPSFRASLRRLHDLSGDVRLLYQALWPPIAALSASRPHLEASAFVAAAQAQRLDPTFAFLQELSNPEMAILISARHLQLCEREPFTFEMCFYHICQFVKRAHAILGTGDDRRVTVSFASLDTLASRTSMMQAFQRLLDLELLLPEPARVSLTLPTGIASRTGPATSPYGTLPTPTVIPSVLPVRAQVSAKAILESALSPERVEPLSSVMIKWAESTGL